MTSKQKFIKYYEKIHPLLYDISTQYTDNKYIVKFNKKNYEISFDYGLFHSSMYINDCEICLYLRSEDMTYENSTIIDTRKKLNMNYDELYSLFRKIKKIIIITD
jgi:hypothetical protein